MAVEAVLLLGRCCTLLIWWVLFLLLIQRTRGSCEIAAGPPLLQLLCQMIGHAYSGQ